MNYVYGRNRLAVKSILKENFSDIEMNKFVGAFEPYIWIPRNNEIAEKFIRVEKLDIRKFDFLVENLIMSCIIVYWNMFVYGGYRLPRIDQAKVLEDLEAILFAKIDSAYGNGCADDTIRKLKERCDKIRRGFVSYYMRVYNKLKRHWDGKKPDDKICSRFETGYFYRKRAGKKNVIKKEGRIRADWSWTENLAAGELAEELVRRGIDIDSTACREAFKKRKISVKLVRNELSKYDPVEIAVNNWFYSKTEEQRDKIIYYACKYAANELDYNSYCNIIVRAYGYDENWLKINNSVKLTDTIVNESKHRFDTGNKTRIGSYN